MLSHRHPQQSGTPKGEEAKVLKDLIESQGFKTSLWTPPSEGTDRSTCTFPQKRSLVWEAGTFRDMRDLKEHGANTPIMIKGASIKVQELLANGLRDGNHRIRRRVQHDVCHQRHEALPSASPSSWFPALPLCPPMLEVIIGTKDITMMHSRGGISRDQ